MLPAHEVIPPLTARRPTGQVIRAGDFKQKKNLLIAFLHSGCHGCEKFLGALAAHAVELAEQEAVALGVFPAPVTAFLSERLPPEIIVATDLSGRAQRAYLGPEAFGPAGQQCLGVFVTDRYGELYAQWVGSSEEALPGIRDVFGCLEQIEIVCEERGVSH
jgi:hypothetical protein